ncbi:MAG: PadR family transcriptional regulator [Bacteroidia bacterium]|nr:PadR family transcriptional regulator [Bacteroidia bacterium]
MGRAYLGEFEELVLLMVGVLNEEAYGVAIQDEIKGKADRSVNISAVHTALHRLEEKGYVKSYMGGATAERGGRRKRLFSLTASGKHALDQTRELRNELWQNIPKIAFS